MNKSDGSDGQAATGADVLDSGLLGRTGKGVFSVGIGRRLRYRVIARCAGFHRQGPASVGLKVTPVVSGGRTGQRWARSIEGRDVVSTVVWNDRDRTVVERFLRGLLRLDLRPCVDRSPGLEAARLELLGARVGVGRLSVPVPRWALPTVTTETRRRGDDALWVRVAVRSRYGDQDDIVTYEGVLT